MTATTTVQDGVAELRRFIRSREPWVVDAAVASTFVLVAMLFSGSWVAYTFVWALLFSAPVYFTRRQPHLALGTASALTLAMAVLGFGGGTPTPLLFLAVAAPLFRVSARLDPRSWLFAGACGLVISFACALVAPYGWAGYSVGLALVVGAGIGSAAFRARGAERSARAVAEADRDLAEQAMAIEQERGRVAREVHDIVAHSLAVVIAQADGARYTAEQHPDRVAPALAAIADTARSSLGEIRLLLHELRQTDGLAPTPVYRDVDTLVDGVRELGLQVDVASYGPRRELPDEAQAALFRIVQEALTNALRHGDRTRPVRLDTEWGDRTLTVTVTNDLLPDGVPQIAGPGHGIPGMRERTQLAGGDFAVGVGDNGRFRVRASLPVPVADGAETRLVPVAAAG